MSIPQSHGSFSGSIPENYDTYLGPLIFEKYAADITGRVQKLTEGSILETAAGTGIVTKHLREALPSGVSITATDLNEGMLEYAKKKFKPDENIEWKTADATALPFPDRSFDAVVSQFGIMFFPDKLQATREVLRVLKPGGVYLFNVWDSLEHNPLVQTTKDAISGFFPDGPPTFFQTPFGYYKLDPIKELLLEAGFEGDIDMRTLPRESTTDSARSVALGFITGSPMSIELAERSHASIEEAISAVEKAIAREHGDPPSGKMQAIVVASYAKTPR